MLWLVIVLMSIITLFSFDEQIVNGTTGTPLEGLGAGLLSLMRIPEHSQR